MSSNKSLSLVFDLDGCLLDTSEGIRESVEFTLSTLGIDFKNEGTDINLFIGPPIQTSLKRYCNLNDEDAQAGATIFRNYYKENALLKARVYPGMIETLNQLKTMGIKMAVATYKREDYAIKIIDAFNLSSYFETVHGADHYNILTKKDIIKRCIKELNLVREGTIMVGDTLHDYKGASDSGIKFIGVTWGFGFKSDDNFNDSDFISMANIPGDLVDISKSLIY